eukprot:m.28014 g.28014  ORF g.28014 m.28014 type:complete len:210 (-) comp7964_c0_seq1:44-673(-)
MSLIRQCQFWGRGLDSNALHLRWLVYGISRRPLHLRTRPLYYPKSVHNFDDDGNSKNKRQAWIDRKVSDTREAIKEEYKGRREDAINKLQDSGSWLSGRLSKLYKEYGRTVLVTYVTLDVICLSSCYLAVKYGINVADVLEVVGLENFTSSVSKEAGTFVLALALNKITIPFRMAITAASAPTMSRILKERLPSLFGPPDPKKNVKGDS